MNRNKANAEKY